MDVGNPDADGTKYPPERGVSVIVPESCTLRQIRSIAVPCRQHPDSWCVERFSLEKENRTARSYLPERYFYDGFVNQERAAVKSVRYTGLLSGQCLDADCR